MAFSFLIVYVDVLYVEKAHAAAGADEFSLKGDDQSALWQERAGEDISAVV